MAVQYVKESRFLCFVLRHKPDAIGISLDSGGWADIETLLAKLQENGHNINRGILDTIVATDDKGRYQLDESKTRIRCCHGHSVPVDLSETKAIPPAVLYHGTASRFVPAISREGLKPQGRQFVHMSTDVETATIVGKRHDKTATDVPVFVIDSRRMADDGFEFFISKDGVWLCSSVPPAYLRLLK